MPTFVYKCKKCQHTFEVWAKMTDPAPAECEKCKAPREFLEKVIQAVATVLKGGGWYKGGY